MRRLLPPPAGPTPGPRFEDVGSVRLLLVSTLFVAAPPIALWALEHPGFVTAAFGGYAAARVLPVLEGRLAGEATRSRPRAD